MKLAENPYVAIQGEGVFVGIPMTYVRFQGCPVGCVWCDSMYTWEPYGKEKFPNPNKVEYDVKSLRVAVNNLGAKHVWFTGGEPSIYANEIKDFLVNHSDNDHVYHICTAGWKWDNELYLLLDAITVDVKAPTSKTKSNDQVLTGLYTNEALRQKTEFKMVLANNEHDRKYAIEMVKKYPFIDWTFQPLYDSEKEIQMRGKKRCDDMRWELQEFHDWITLTFKKYDKVRMGLQLHKHIWPEKMRGI